MADKTDSVDWEAIADRLAAALRTVNDPLNEWAERRVALRDYDSAARGGSDA